MKFGALALAGAVSAFDGLVSETEYKFMKYITEEGKSYGTTAEFNFRLAQFAKRVAEHERWNAMPG